MEQDDDRREVLTVARDARRRVRDTVILHPGQPLMYFTPYFPTSMPELDFKTITYYETRKAYTEDKKVDPEVIRAELVMDDVQRFGAKRVSRVMKLPNGEHKAAYLPLLLDIHGYLQHKGISVFVKWLYKHNQFDDGEVVPKDICPIFNLVPTFDAESTLTYSYPIRERHIFFGAKTNSLHVTKIEGPLSALHISIFSGVTQKKGVHYHRLSISGEVPIVGKERVFGEGSYVIFWNATDVLRPSFVNNFRQLFASYEPAVVIITEARPKYLQIWELIPLLPGPYEYSSTGHAVVGGVVMLWNKYAQPDFTRRSCCLSGPVMAVEVLPGIHPRPPIWEGIEVEDSDDDYDYIGAWLSDSGLDMDPSIHDEGWC